MSNEMRIERVMDAPPDVVFAGFTSHAGQVAFYGTDDPGWIVESRCELRVGGVWAVTFGPSPDHLYRHRHRFEAIEPPERIALTTTEHRLDGSSFDFTIEFSFEGQDGKTLMRMVQSGFPTAELREEHGRGVPNALRRLEDAIFTLER